MCTGIESGHRGEAITTLPRPIPEAHPESIPLEPVDTVEITVLMDNIYDGLMVSTEPARRASLGQLGRMIAGRVAAPQFEGGTTVPGLVAQHGFSALVKVSVAGRPSRTVLFDTGISPDGVATNIQLLEDASEPEPYTEPLDPGGDIGYAAERLVGSVIMALRDGWYDDRLDRAPALAHLMTVISPQGVVQTLEFVGWLRRREPELSLTGNIPTAVLEEKIFEFCEEVGYTDAKSFSKQARRWLNGTGDPSMLRRLARALGIDRRGFESSNPLDRYGAVRFHALFLFLSAGDFPHFIDQHWRDLHHLTGDDLDIYYSEKDLSDRVSGYEVAPLFREVSVRPDALPAMLLWEEQLAGAGFVLLEGLDHDDIVAVVQAIVQEIRCGRSLYELVACGNQKRLDLKGAHGAVVVQGRQAFVVAGGGTVGDIYTNEGGIVGAMGREAIAHDNTFLMDARSALAEAKLTAEEYGVISELARRIVSLAVDGVEFRELLEGASYLDAIAEAGKTDQPVDRGVAGWRGWLAKLGARADSLLSALTSLAAITEPIRRVLGLGK